jgi:hypothetical protein
VSPKSSFAASFSNNQGYELTQAGHRFLVKVEAVESAVVSTSVITGDDAQIAGTVGIGVPGGFGTIFLAPLLGELTWRYPGLTVEIFAAPRQFSLSKRDSRYRHKNGIVAMDLFCRADNLVPAADLRPLLGRLHHQYVRI